MGVRLCQKGVKHNGREWEAVEDNEAASDCVCGLCDAFSKTPLPVSVVTKSDSGGRQTTTGGVHYVLMVLISQFAFIITQLMSNHCTKSKKAKQPDYSVHTLFCRYLLTALPVNVSLNMVTKNTSTNDLATGLAVKVNRPFFFSTNIKNLKLISFDAKAWKFYFKIEFLLFPLIALIKQ